MSANTNNQGPTGSNIVTIEGTASSSAAPATTTYRSDAAPTNASSEPITITRRINVKIQGSMSDFAQDGQVSHGIDVPYQYIPTIHPYIPVHTNYTSTYQLSTGLRQ